MTITATGARGETRGSARSAGKSALTRAATFPITALSTLVTASLTIQYAGPQSYAAIATLITLSQLVPFADLGVGAGVVNAVSSGDRAEARAAVASATRVLLMSAAGLLTIATAVSLVVGWDTILGIADAPLPHAGAAALVVIAIIAISLPFGVGQRVLIGAMRNPTAIALSTIAPLFTLAGSALIVWLRLSPTFLVLPAVIGSMAVAVVSSVVAARIVGTSFMDIFRPNDFRYRGLLRIGGWYLLLTLASAIAFPSGRVILAHAANLEVVADFSLAMQFYVPLWSFFVAGGTALWPVFARLRSSATDSRPLVLRMVGFFVCAAALCGAGLTIAGPWVARLLAHGNIDPSWTLFAAASLLIVVQAVQLVQGVSLTDRAGIRFQALCALPLVVVVPALTFAGAGLLGASSPFVAATVGVVVFQVLPNAVRLRAGARAGSSNQSAPEVSHE